MKTNQPAALLCETDMRTDELGVQGKEMKLLCPTVQGWPCSAGREGNQTNPAWTISRTREPPAVCNPEANSWWVQRLFLLFLLTKQRRKLSWCNTATLNREILHQLSPAASHLQMQLPHRKSGHSWIHWKLANVEVLWWIRSGLLSIANSKPFSTSTNCCSLYLQVPNANECKEFSFKLNGALTYHKFFIYIIHTLFTLFTYLF